ncbi:MAG: VOC family protein [Spirochaetaceae bacterium]|nr:VOC family protein [Spirochaetaceae bacterium]
MPNQKINIFLTFTGQAEEAMNFYAANLPQAKITQCVPYGAGNPMMAAGEENFIMHGQLEFMGQTIMFLDMSKQYPAPAFAWSTSIYIDCTDEVEFDAVFAALSKEGSVMMGPESVGDIKKCAWVTDKFGITWQPVWIG